MKRSVSSRAGFEAGYRAPWLRREMKLAAAFLTLATTPSKSILPCLALNDFISSKAAFRSISRFDAFVLFSNFFISSPSSASFRSRSFNSFAVSSPFHGS